MADSFRDRASNRFGHKVGRARQNPRFGRFSSAGPYPVAHRGEQPKTQYLDTLADYAALIRQLRVTGLLFRGRVGLLSESLLRGRGLKTPKTTKYEPFLKRRYLTWFGVIGLSLTLIGTLEPLIKLANVVHFAVENWRALTGIFWNSIASLFDVKLSHTSIALLNGGIFAFAIEIASYPRERIQRSLWWLPLRLFNAAVVAFMSWGIAVAAIWPDMPNVSPLPDPMVLENWKHKDTLVPLLCWSFLGIQTPCVFGVDPVLMARRLLDVAACLLVIFGLNYVATHAELIHGLLGGTLSPLK